MKQQWIIQKEQLEYWQMQLRIAYRTVSKTEAQCLDNVMDQIQDILYQMEQE